MKKLQTVQNNAYTYSGSDWEFVQFSRFDSENVNFTQYNPKIIINKYLINVFTIQIIQQEAKF